GVGLADWLTAGDAGGTEWRTPPLWGIGLTETVNGHTFFLHDGRARNLTEAILWHGGEGQAARDGFAALSAGDRAALIKFVESL
ncbi:MAG: thiol oxidoreductase, partial [Notoacmeibacter sp.]|nr:thiol oxidoreductase [Notoacmeibacter sp.]